MSYAETQRLRFIDFLADHYGAVNRSAIMDFWGVSQPQASADIKRYMNLAPRNLVYDKSKKTYVPSVDFARVWP